MEVSVRCAPPESASRPLRPLLPVALAALFGAAAGQAIGSPPLSATALCLMALAALGLLKRLPRPPRRGIWPAGVPVWLGLAALTALSTPQSSPRTDAPLAGLWRTEVRSTPPGREHTTRGQLTPTGTRPLAVDLSGPAPSSGEAVALLPPMVTARPARPPWGADDGDTNTSPLRAPAAQLVRLGPGASGAAASLTAAWRARLLERVDRLEDPVARGLAASLCLGDRSRLPWGLADLFTRTGTRHLLAVSGLHVGLLALLLGFPALLVPRRTGRRISQRNGHGRGRVRPAAALLRAGLILILVPLTGGAPPVRRAALVLALASAAPALPGTNGLRRRADPLSLWSLALALELLSNPLAFDSLSLRLSYTATLGLILGAGPLDRLLGRHLPWFGPIAPVGRLADPRRSLWRVPLGLFLRAVRGSLAVSLAAVGATLPFAWTVFGEWSPVGPAATCLALIPVALLLASGWVMLLAGDLAWIAEPLGEVFTVTAHALVASLEIWDALPGTPTPLPPRPVALVWIAVIGGFALLRQPRDKSTPLRTARRWIARTTALAWSALLLPWSAAPLGLEVHVLDVGHGTAVVLRAPGEPAWVLDAGSRDRPGVARRAVAPLLRLWDVGTIGVVLTHGDADHAGALPWIVARFPARLWAGAPPPGDLSPKSIGERLDLVAGRKRIPPRRSGEHVPRLVLLRGGDARGNEGSRALEVTWEGHRLLLTGDAEGEGLAAQLRAGWVHGPLDLLLLPHHGSQTPYLGPLLSVTMPERVWVSESGLPSLAPELDRRGLSWSCTGRDGPLSLFLAGGDAVRSRTDEQQLWNGINPE